MAEVVVAEEEAEEAEAEEAEEVEAEGAGVVGVVVRGGGVAAAVVDGFEKCTRRRVIQYDRIRQTEQCAVCNERAGHALGPARVCICLSGTFLSSFRAATPLNLD